MKKAIVILFLLAFVPILGNAQSRRDRKKPVYSYQEGLEYSYNRDLDNSKGVPMANLYRDDLLYHSESAYVTPDDRSNISLLKYSRLGIGHDLELSTNIGEDAFRPIIGAKYQWAQWGKMSRVNIISSSLSLSSFYPGFQIAKRLEIDNIVTPGTTIAKAGEIGHELLYTRVWSSDPNCSTGNPYAALTVGLGTYWGINLSDTAMVPMRYHVLAQRSPTYCKTGFRMHVKCWADGYINPWLTLHGGLFLQVGAGLKHPVSLEGRVEAEVFLSPKLSLTLGGIGSLGNFEGVKTLAMGYPMFDLTFYFGKKRSMSGLFDLKL